MYIQKNMYLPGNMTVYTCAVFGPECSFLVASSIIAGSGNSTHFYSVTVGDSPQLFAGSFNSGFLQRGYFGKMTIPAFFKVHPWGDVFPAVVTMNTSRFTTL